MSQLITVTSQGQISIPAPLRRLFGLTTGSRVFVSAAGHRIIVEPASDFLSLKGSLASKAVTGPTSQIIKQEEQAISSALAQKHKNPK